MLSPQQLAQAACAPRPGTSDGYRAITPANHTDLGKTDQVAFIWRRHNQDLHYDARIAFDQHLSTTGRTPRELSLAYNQAHPDQQVNFLTWFNEAHSGHALHGSTKVPLASSHPVLHWSSEGEEHELQEWHDDWIDQGRLLQAHQLQYYTKHFINTNAHPPHSAMSRATSLKDWVIANAQSKDRSGRQSKGLAAIPDMPLIPESWFTQRFQPPRAVQPQTVPVAPMMQPPQQPQGPHNYPGIQQPPTASSYYIPTCNQNLHRARSMAQLDLDRTGAFRRRADSMYHCTVHRSTLMCR